MDQELKAKWVEALRSGKYKQARKTLQEKGALCCLGVLSKCVEPEMWVTYPSYDVLGKAEQEYLSSRNDGTFGHRPHSFIEIADYIEKNL